MRQGYADLPAGLGATVLATAGLAWVATGTTETATAWGWLAYMLLLVTARGLSVIFYRQRREGALEYERWHRYFIAGAALSGLGWGFAAWMFHPILSHEELPFLILVISGITAGATRSLGPSLCPREGSTTRES